MYFCLNGFVYMFNNTKDIILKKTLARCFYPNRSKTWDLNSQSLSLILNIFRYIYQAASAINPSQSQNITRQINLPHDSELNEMQQLFTPVTLAACFMTITMAPCTSK